VAGGLVHCSSAWPSEVAKQSDFDSVVCDICRDPGGFDNMGHLPRVQPLHASALCYASYVHGAHW
jgi:hypothetical protein